MNEIESGKLATVIFYGIEPSRSFMADGSSTLMSTSFPSSTTPSSNAHNIAHLVSVKFDLTNYLLW